jgi:hypothetical protein
MSFLSSLMDWQMVTKSMRSFENPKACGALVFSVSVHALAIRCVRVSLRIVPSAEWTVTSMVSVV